MAIGMGHNLQYLHLMIMIVKRMQIEACCSCSYAIKAGTLSYVTYLARAKATKCSRHKLFSLNLLLLVKNR